MKFFDRIFKESEKETEARNIHPDFQTDFEGFWVYNREWDVFKDRFSAKVRFAFNDKSLLDNCPFYAKIGKNLDQNIPEPYIGFAYATENEKTNLVQWAQKFPYSELIEGSDVDVTKDTKRTVLKNEAEEDNRPA